MRSSLVAVAVLAAPVIAYAQPVTPREDTSSYRLQTVLADATAIGIGVFASKTEGVGDAIGIAAVATYMFGAPMIHMAHHHGERAAASLGLRVGLPILGGLIGHAFAPPVTGQDWGNLGAFMATALGVAVGGVAASAIDIGALSGASEARTAPSIAPAFGAGPGQVRFGIGGTF